MTENNRLADNYNTNYLIKLFNPKSIFILLSLFIFIKMLVLNFLTPLMLDDFYASSTTIFNVMQHEYGLYMNWSGRMVLFFLSRVFLMYPKIIFNFVNTLVYMGFILLIYKIAIPKKELHISLYFFIVLSLWLFILSYGQVIFWVMGSINYLWGTAIILSFLLPYCLYFSDKPVFKHKYIPIGGMLLLGIIAGWCNENTSGGMIMITILLLIGCLIFKLKITLWMISGLIGGITGFLFMILAPGNFVRAQHPAFIDDRHILVIMSERFTKVTGIIRDDFSVLIIIFIILVTMQIVLNKDWKRTYISFTFFVTSIATAYAMILAPYIPERTMFGAAVFIIIAYIHAFAGITFDKEPYKIALISFLCILAFLFSTSFVIAIRDFGLSMAKYNKIEAIIKSEVAHGNTNIIIPFSLIPRPQSQWHPEFSESPPVISTINYFIHLRFADKYDLESIEVQ